MIPADTVGTHYPFGDRLGPSVFWPWTTRFPHDLLFTLGRILGVTVLLRLLHMLVME